MSTIRRIAHRTARKAANTLPPHLREIALALAARATDGPALLPGPPEGRVVVLAAHPDDETIGAGGTIARHAARGDDIAVVVATSGEATSGGRGDVGMARERECRAALADLGVTRNPVFCRLPDSTLHAAVDTLATALQAHASAADVIYAPSVLDPHRDHLALNVALAMAGLDADVYGYEVWSPAPVDVLIDIADTWEDKRRALAQYRTALESVDYVRVAEGLAAYRSAAGGLMGAGHAEGFLTLDAGTHRAAVGDLSVDGDGPDAAEGGSA